MSRTCQSHTSKTLEPGATAKAQATPPTVCTVCTTTHITGGMEWMDHGKSLKKDVLGKRERTHDLSDEVVISGTFA